MTDTSDNEIRDIEVIRDLEVIDAAPLAPGIRVRVDRWGELSWQNVVALLTLYDHIYNAKTFCLGWFDDNTGEIVPALGGPYLWGNEQRQDVYAELIDVQYDGDWSPINLEITKLGEARRQHIAQAQARSQD